MSSVVDVTTPPEVVSIFTKPIMGMFELAHELVVLVVPEMVFVTVILPQLNVPAGTVIVS